MSTTTLTCFKAYDIRGKLGDELNEDVAYRIGRAYAQYTQAKEVVVGGDVRETSEPLKLALADGLTDGGTKVIDLGLCGTEHIYFATSHLKTDGGICVTASHNPIDYNGMKLVREQSKPISGDTGLHDIQRLAELNDFGPVVSKASISQVDISEAYTDHLLTYIDTNNIKPMRIVVNAGNGAAGPAIDYLESVFNRRNIPVELIKIHHEPDGTFPNGIPNPLLHENQPVTSNAVLEHNADLGVAWDGDFDRCFLFDEKGQFIEGYYIVGLLAENFLAKQPGSKIIHDPRLTWNTIDIVEQAGGQAIESKTGHAFIKERMREEDAVYGGEMSAHHYFRDFAYCDSGMIPWLLVAELICIKGQPLSALVSDRISQYPSPGEINSKLQQPKAAIERVLAHYKASALKIEHVDGISLTFDNWRFNLRSSNTEPVVRLNVETRGDQNLMTAKTEEVLSILRQE